MSEPLHPLDDEQALRCVRGIAAVDRAVRHFERREPGHGFDELVPPAIAKQIQGWTVCARCGRPLSPGWCVQRGEERFHPSCLVVLLGEREDRERPSCGAAGAVFGPSRASGSPPLPSQGDAGSRIAAGGLLDTSSAAAAA